ncbi:MAG: hypothetical protein PHI23_02140 [Candidatus Peribacteraceae bacterium]|nr:hypothetical protein [Candidatus Peribacteraceae bacterium]
MSNTHPLHRIVCNVFVIAGMLLVTSTMSGLAAAQVSPLSGQGSINLHAAAPAGATLRQGFLFTTSGAQEDLLARLVLGALFFLIGFGFHAVYASRHAEGERIVRVRRGKGRKQEPARTLPPVKHWVLWMNVRI